MQSVIMLATHPYRFTNIVNHSIDVEFSGRKRDVAIASATDRLSGQRFTFVSAHVWGFNFTEEVTVNTAAQGDDTCDKVTLHLDSEIPRGTFEVIGADMNANPEKWNPRFEILTRKGLKTHRTGETTNVNPLDVSDKEREIDFIFTRSNNREPSVWERIKSIFFSTIHWTPSIARVDTFKWDPTEHCSDHLPVFVQFTALVRFSVIRKIWNGVCGLFSCLKRPPVRP